MTSYEYIPNTPGKTQGADLAHFINRKGEQVGVPDGELGDDGIYGSDELYSEGVFDETAGGVYDDGGYSAYAFQSRGGGHPPMSAERIADLTQSYNAMAARSMANSPLSFAVGQPSYTAGPASYAGYAISASQARSTMNSCGGNQ